MCNLKCSIATVIVGVILVIGSCVIAFVVVPILIDSIIVRETVLLDDSIQLDRFETVPFPFHFKITIWTISNPQQVLNGGAPSMVEKGPYIYKMYARRNITRLTRDLVTYRRVEHFEFDADASFPHTEDDMVTIVNVPYHAILQIAEAEYSYLLPILNSSLSSVFGNINSPIMTIRARDLFFDGITICQNPGVIGNVVCSIIRSIGVRAKNLMEQADGSMVFSLLSYKLDPSEEFEVYRGMDDPSQLGHIRHFDGLTHFTFWDDGKRDSICNMVNGTDSGIYAPFIDREQSMYAINMDICRSVELRHQYDTEIDGIPVAHFTSNEWFLANKEECFCLNETRGINRENGCLLEGAMEMFSCVGASLVLTYPHFLYADSRYRNAIIGMNPVVDEHRIFISVEPNTGTPIAGAKRGQFNVFQRPIPNVGATQSLRDALVPFVWFEEGVEIPDDLKEELRSRLLARLDLLDVLLPVAIALCAAVLAAGLLCTVRAKRRPTTTTQRIDDNKT